MPFDNPETRVEIDVANREEITILDALAQRLATPDLWCKRHLSYGPSRCLLGALNEEDHGSPFYLWNDTDEQIQFVRPAAHNVGLRLADLVGDQPFSTKTYLQRSAVFNNAPKTTHADILGLIRRARASFE